MAFRNYLEGEDDKPYFHLNSLAHYYEEMQRYAALIKEMTGYIKDYGDELGLTKEEIDARLTAYILENKTQLDQRLGEWDEKLQQFDGSVTELLAEWVDDGTLNHIIDTTLIDEKIQPLTALLGETAKETKKHFITPQYIEYFGSFNRFGLGVPTGISNYPGGNYVLYVSGNAGDNFLTVQSGNIADAGATNRWACVIENDDKIFSQNQVTGTDGISKVNLLMPLDRNITNKRLGNLHEHNTGQHYSELGYFAYTQHFYFMNPRHTERDTYIAQMKSDAISGKWVINANSTTYNNNANPKRAEGYYGRVGGKALVVVASGNAHYAEWEQFLDERKGYFESYIGTSHSTLLVEFFLDGVLKETQIIGPTVEPVTFNFQNAKLGKVKITPQGIESDFTTQSMYIGQTTWWENSKFQEDVLILPNDKVAYIGDSWGEFHNKATTRELSRLMMADGGTPTVLDFSKGGHTSTYARVWFEEHILANKPDKVIIEYFTNDFNSINGTAISTFTNPDGQQQDMGISSLNEYIFNMKFMIDLAIENGIQPIIIMPASVGSESQALSAANFAVQLWLGKALVNENPNFKDATAEKLLTSLIESRGSETIGSNVLKLIAKEINSSIRKGVMSDSDRNLTGGDIHGFYNNGVRKSGIKFDGALEVPYAKLMPKSFLVGANETNRGYLTLVNGTETSGADILQLVIKNADGTFASKKIQLID